MSYGKRCSEGKVPVKAERPAVFLRESSPDAIYCERKFIIYLAERLRKLCPLKSREECAQMVITMTGRRYREWFEGMVKVETNVDFVGLYGKPDGPERIFREIYPNQTVEQFLEACLNGDDGQAPVNERVEAVRRAANDTINQT